MDKETRLAVLILVIAIAIWRIARYMRFGLSRSRRPTSLGVAGGLIPQDADRTASAADPSSPVSVQSFLYARIVGILVTVALCLVINALLWYCLLELPPLKSLPPVPVGVAGIFANFYLIPLARRVGARSRRRIEGGACQDGAVAHIQHQLMRSAGSSRGHKVIQTGNRRKLQLRPRAAALVAQYGTTQWGG